MRVDLEALRRAAAGDPSRKLAVKVEWLGAVLLDLEELQRRQAADHARPVSSRMAETFHHLFGDA